MSGTDQIVINTRERASSGDVNDIQSLKDRTQLDSWLELYQSRAYTVGAQPTESSQPVILGGLEIGPSGTDIAIQAGVLMQDSTTLLPAVGALDSDYRWAALRASLIEANPAPGGDTYYLLEAQMSEVTAATATRDIFDTGTGLFVPTLVDKRTERTVIVQLVAGDVTNFPIPSGGDWVVIGGVLVPTGGGAIPAANFFDMRPLADDLAGAVRPAASQGKRQVIFETPNDNNDAQKQFVFEAEAWVDGRRLWFETSETGLTLDATTLALFQDGVTSPTTVSTLSYLYLAPLALAASPTSFVRNAYVESGQTVINGNSLLVWSTNAPGADRMGNSIAIDLPAPFDNYVVPIGEAVCIGALHTNAGGTVESMGSLGTNSQSVDTSGGTFIPGWGNSLAPTGGNDTFAMADVPVCAKTMRVMLQWTRHATGTVNETVSVLDTASGDIWHTFRGNWDVSGQVEFTVPRRTGLDVNFGGATPPVSASVYLLGWSL